MRLAKPFYRLPVRFDAERLRAEAAALPAGAWADHPNEIEGNSSVRLISAGGGENDDVNGVMLPTPHLQQCPYMVQVLASFGVVWSRSRLMRLQPHAVVPEHADINYHWFNRVRLHIPVLTRPEVQFHCDGQVVHMAAGEAWVFDNWRRHRVDNPTDDIRIHLVADTSGTSSFWQFVAQSDQPGVQHRQFNYDPARKVPLLTERAGPRPVMLPAEVDLLSLDMRNELAAASDTPQSRAQLGRYHALLDGFCRDWRQLYLLHGESEAGLAEYERLRDALRNASRAHGEGLSMRTNSVAVHAVLEGRLLRHLLNFPSQPPSVPPPLRAASQPAASYSDLASAQRPRRITRSQLQQPLFIVAAPRSGSTLLFETLAVTPQLCTLGGEAHWLVELIPQLKPGAPGVDSNRLTAEHYTPEVEQLILAGILDNLRNARGRRSMAPVAHSGRLRRHPRMRCESRSSHAFFPTPALSSCGASRKGISPASSRRGAREIGRPTATSRDWMARGRCSCRPDGRHCAGIHSRKSRRISGTAPIASFSKTCRHCRVIAGRRYAMSSCSPNPPEQHADCASLRVSTSTPRCQSVCPAPCPLHATRTRRRTRRSGGVMRLLSRESVLPTAPASGCWTSDRGSLRMDHGGSKARVLATCLALLCSLCAWSATQDALENDRLQLTRRFAPNLTIATTRKRCRQPKG